MRETPKPWSCSPAHQHQAAEDGVGHHHRVVAGGMALQQRGDEAPRLFHQLRQWPALNHAGASSSSTGRRFQTRPALSFISSSMVWPPAQDPLPAVRHQRRDLSGRPGSPAGCRRRPPAGGGAVDGLDAHVLKERPRARACLPSSLRFERSSRPRIRRP